MSYDRMDWHSGGNYPAGLPPENAGTHIGMFLAWAFKNGLAGPLHTKKSAKLLSQLGRREITGRDFLIEACDGKFWKDDLNDTGQAFAADYYENESGFAKQFSSYLNDYCNVFDQHAAANNFEYESTYHVENTWENYDRLEPLLDERFCRWQVWRAEPGNTQVDPRQRFLDACTAVGEILSARGFKPSQKGATWKKVAPDRDTVFELVFYLRRYNTRYEVQMTMGLAVYSRKLKSWLIAKTGNRHGTGLIFEAGLNLSVQDESWEVAGNQFDPSVQAMRRCIQDVALPVFELFSDRAKTLEHLAEHGSRFGGGFKRESLTPLTFMLLFGTPVQAERFFNLFVHSVPAPWRAAITKHYAELSRATSIDLKLPNYSQSDIVKLAFEHGLRLLPKPRIGSIRWLKHRAHLLIKMASTGAKVR